MVEYFVCDSALTQTPLDFKWHSGTVNADGFTVSGNTDKVTLSANIRFDGPRVKVSFTAESFTSRDRFSFEFQEEITIADLLLVILSHCTLFGERIITHKVPNTRIQGELL